MNFRKKATISALLVAMTAASVNGLLPGSPAVISGLSVQSVSADGNLVPVSAELDKIYTELSKDQGGLEAVRQLRDQLQGISSADFHTAMAPLLVNLPDGVSEHTLYSLFHETASLSYDASYRNLIAIRKNPEYIAAAKAFGQAGGVDNLTVDDLVAFGQVVKGQISSILSSKTLSELGNLLNSTEAQKQFILDVFHGVMNQPVGSGPKLSQVLNNLHITENDMATSLNNIAGLVDPATLRAATVALAKAYIAAEGIKPPGGGDGGITPPPGNGGTPPGGGGTTPPPVTNTGDPSVIDASAWVTITNGAATVALDQKAVLDAIAKLKELHQTTLTLDLKTVDAKSISLPISKAIVDAAKAAGILSIVATSEWIDHYPTY